MAPKCILLVALSLGLVVLTSSYPSGAPEETCKVFTAKHEGHSTQDGEAPYNIIFNPSSVSSGGKVTVSIEGVGSEVFKGFFIQGQDESTNKPVGKFVTKADAQLRHCSGPGSADSATHVNSNEKSKIILEWTAPESFKGKVVFRAVVVKTYELFWDNLLSNPLTVV